MTRTYERLEGSDRHVVGYRLHGRPAPEHVDEVVAEIKERIRRYGDVRVLLQLPTAERPDLPTAWRELRHLSSELGEVTKVAIVGTRLQERWSVGIFGALVPVPVRYFQAREMDSAWEWLRR